MRRWAAAGVALSAVVLVGCTRQPATVHRPPALPASASPSPSGPFVPKVGTCYPGSPVQSSETFFLGGVDCVKEHRSETVYIGQLTGAVASLGTPPGTGDGGLVTADTQCAQGAVAYVGGPLATLRLAALIAVPSKEDWADGARWFECHVVTIRSLPGPDFENRVGSVKGVAATPTPPACFVLAKPNTSAGMTPAACDGPHSAEFVAALSAPLGSPYPATDQQQKPYISQCHDQLAAVMGVSGAAVDRNWGYDEYSSTQQQWSSGVRVIQCYFVLWNAKTITKSIRGSQGAGIPQSW